VETLAGNFGGVVQYNGDNRAFEGAVDVNVTIPVVCGLMNQPGVDPLQAYANVNSLLLNTYSEPCLDYSYMDAVNSLQNTSVVNSGGRQWTYQTCTEFGYFQSSDSTNQPFGSGFPLSFAIQQCMDVFGPQFNQQFISNGIEWTNDYYGGSNVAGTNIVLPNGSVDPWHFLGLTTSPSSSVVAVFIVGSAHCGDMYPSTPNDSINVQEARALIGANIAMFLDDAAKNYRKNAHAHGRSKHHHPHSSSAATKRRA